MTKYITEILEEINKSPSKIKSYVDNYAIKTLLEYAFDPDKKFLLPEGKPPYKPDAAPLGMSPGNLYQQIKKLYIFGRADVSKLRLEQLFIQMLESIHPTEAELMVAVKDKVLTDLYPNITKELLVEVGILNAEMFPQSTDDGKGQKLVLNLSDSVKTEESFGKPKTETKEVAPEVPTKEELEKLTKLEIDEIGKKFGVQLDRRKKKESMIEDFFNFATDDLK